MKHVVRCHVTSVYVANKYAKIAILAQRYLLCAEDNEDRSELQI